MRVLFLALGATRRSYPIGESADLVARGGEAVVVVDSKRTWRRERFADGVTVLELARLQPRHSPGALAWLVLFRAPALAFWVCGRGPLTDWTRRAEAAYWRRLAARVRHGSRLLTAGPVVPADAGGRLRRHVARDVRDLLIRYQLLRGARFDVLVIADPASIPDGARMVRTRPSARLAPRVCYSLDAVAAGPA
jgi:hypothetical protein